MVLLLRVDYRLIHGQIAAAWVGQINADCILIANDQVPGDALRKSALKLAKPPQTKLVIKTVDDSIRALNSGVTDKYRLFILVENATDAKRLVDACPSINRVNIGNIRMKQNARQIGMVWMTKEEQDIFKEIQQKGIQVDIQGIPRDKIIIPDFSK